MQHSVATETDDDCLRPPDEKSSPSPSIAQSFSSNGSAGYPRFERGSSTGSSASAGNRAPDDVDVMALEETMLACLSLAQICQAKQSHAVSLFEMGVMKTMLRIVRSPYMEVHRQVRCGGS